MKQDSMVTENQGVGGSIPPLGTPSKANKINNLLAASPRRFQGPRLLTVTVL